jgi:hypothetical protein
MAWGQGQGPFYYCATNSALKATVYFSDIFTVPPGTDMTLIRQGFASYLAVHFNEPLMAKSHCVPESDMHQASLTQGKEELNYENLRWRVNMTHWRF